MQIPLLVSVCFMSGWQNIYFWSELPSCFLFPQSCSRYWERCTKTRWAGLMEYFQFSSLISEAQGLEICCFSFVRCVSWADTSLNCTHSVLVVSAFSKRRKSRKYIHTCEAQICETAGQILLCSHAVACHPSIFHLLNFASSLFLLPELDTTFTSTLLSI